MRSKFDFLEVAVGVLSERAGPTKFLRRPEANKILAQRYRFDAKTSKAVIDKLSRKGFIKKSKRGINILI